MAFYKAQEMKKNGKYYPVAVVQGKPVDTDTIAGELAKRSTVSRADCFAVLKDIGDVMAGLMAQGKSVRLEGLGTFRLTIDSVRGGADSADEVDASLIEGVRVRFIPETTRRADGSVSTRAGVADRLEWVKLPAGTEEADDGSGDNGGGSPDPTA